MEYQVPQFIEVENKIVGPLTLRQFIYLAGAGGLCVVFFAFMNTVLAVILSLPVAALGAALAFYKVNEKPFIEILEAGLRYYTGTKLLLWKHEERRTGKTAEPSQQETPTEQSSPRLTRGKLSDLAWSLDIQRPASDSPPQHYAK